MIGSCMNCGKPLTRAVSLERGVGPICYSGLVNSITEYDGVQVDLPFDPVSMDIHCERRFDVTHFNIFQVYRHHSPTGMEWGYAGSGPADFAMNILELFMRDVGHTPLDVITCYEDGKSFEKRICTWTLVLYQDFKFKFVTALPREGGTIKGKDIRAWIKKAQREKVSHYARRQPML